MRRSTPLTIVLLAVLVYAAREELLSPLVNSPLGPSGDVPVLAGAVEGPALLPGVETLARVPESEAPAAATSEPERGRIRKNSSLYLELTRLGVSPVEIDRLVRASRGTYNFKRVRPGQRFALYRSQSAGLDSLELAVNAEQHLKVRRRGESFHAEIESIPCDVTYHVTQGTVRTSIFAALKTQDAETELASGLDEIFGWTIDFISDIREGDSFAILYERKAFDDGRTILGDILAARVVNRGNDHYAFRFETTDGRSVGYFDLEGKSLQKSLRRSPLKFTRVSSSFSTRRFHPVYKSYRPHYGVDYGAPRGTPVHATGEGVVEVAGRRSGNGNYVRIRHNNTYTTYYLHLHGFAKGIRRGVRVRQGQVIGYVGSTGAAKGTHVCYRIKRGGSWVNPRTLKLPSKSPVPADQLAAFERLRDGYLFRMGEPLLEGLDNNTVAVERPTLPTGVQMRTPF